MTDKTTKRGIRYTAEKKAEIVAFVLDHNAKNNGRGGPAAATRKYGISQVTIGNWVKAHGGGSKSGRSSAKSGQAGNTMAQLKRMMKLQDKISKQEAVLDALKDEFETLKKSI